MLLRGSCHCGLVRFSVQSREALPYQYCYCSICRKTGGAGGYMINLGGVAQTLVVEGEKHIKIYRAMVEKEAQKSLSEHQRIFCSECGSHLWAFNPRWPELIHPVAGAIDTELPLAPERSHMMLESKANWVTPSIGPSDSCSEQYPSESLADWHSKRGLST